MEEAQRFYGEVLGLKLKGRSVGAIVFDVGGRDLRVSPVPGWKPTEHTVFGFGVTDIYAAVSELSAKGVTIERTPHLQHDAQGVVAAPDGAKVAWFRDPERNWISIVQYAN
jgi:catechol 2,3-dioxygenase-like lactoylglutathione lyase family enzyme